MEEYGIEGKLLMENAAHAVYFIILKVIGNVRGKNFVTFAGPGNNGGDAIAVSRKLYSNGANVKIYLMNDHEKYKGHTRMNYEIAEKIGIPTEQFMGDNAIVRKNITTANAIVDGMLKR